MTAWWWCLQSDGVTNSGGSRAGKPNTSVCVPQGTTAIDRLTIPATVPGDLVTDLQNAGALVGDPLTDSNFMNASMWNGLCPRGFLVFFGGGGEFMPRTKRL